MAYNAQVIRILIASPSDCKEERELVPHLLQKWNSLHASELKTVLLPAKWEDDSYPSLDDRPQELINKQIVRDADILIGFFWTRLGTATGKAASGSVEEINEFLAANKPVLLYFSNQPVRPDTVKEDQYSALKAFKSAMQAKGLTVDYDDIGRLKESVPTHLTRTIRERFPVVSNEVTPTRQTEREATLTLSEMVKRCALAWSAEKNSDPHTVEEGKAILKSLVDDLLRWRADYEAILKEDVTRDADTSIRGIKGIIQTQLAMDGGASWKTFWDGGDAVFDSLERLAKRLSNGNALNSLSENAAELLNEIDAHPDEEARGITLVRDPDLGVGAGHYFPYQWSPYRNRGESSLTPIKLAPLKIIVSELETKGYVVADSNDGRSYIYSRTVKPAP